MIRSKSLTDPPRPDIREKSAAPDEDVPALLRMIDYLIREVRQIDPICEYFLKMCRLSLLEAEQKRADRIGRH